MRYLPIFTALYLFNSAAMSVEIHLSPKGSDINPGTLEAPVKTLEKARDLGRNSRKRNPGEAVTIQMHPGIWQIHKTVLFTKQDSGTKTAPLIIKNWVDQKKPNSHPQLIGGVMTAEWGKSSFNGRADVYETDLKPLKIRKKFKQIYLNGTRQIWARYPNCNPELPYSGGWAYVDGIRPPMYIDIEGESTDTLVTRLNDKRIWSRPADGEVCIFPRYNWSNNIIPIKEINPETRTVTLMRKMRYAARPEDRYAVFGMKEELDSPGEWYQDVEAQKLYYIPPQDLTDQHVTIPAVNSILKFDGVDNVLIRGLELTCAENHSIYLKNCNKITLEKLLVHDLGYMRGAGITIRGGHNCIIRGCNIWNIGGHGLEVYAGDKVAMDKCNHIVDNCYIHHVGQFNRHGIGIMVSGAGVIISHNLIHDMPRCGIFHGGVLHTLEYNRIRHCNLEMEDTGCTYSGGWASGWTTIRYNHCTDSIGFNNHGRFFVFAWGIYLDESGCGYDVYGNIVERCQVGAMHLHNARENHICNNIFANNGGLNGNTHQFSMQGWTDNPNAKFLKDRQPKMLALHNKLMTNPEWVKMRGMHISPADPFLPDGSIMRGNKIERNIFYYPNQPQSQYIKSSNVNFEYNTIDFNTVWSGVGNAVKTGVHEQVKKATEWESWQKLGADTHSIVADPLFINPDKGDFRLKPDSPALKQGFEPIPIDKIGPYESDARATWPIKEAAGVRENPQWLTPDPSFPGR